MVFSYPMDEAQASEFQRWEKLVKLIQVKGALPVSVEVSYEFYYDIQIRVSAQVPDRDAPHLPGRGLTVISLCRRVPPYRDDIDRLHWLRSLVRDLYLHELDEQFYVDGVRLFDPHVPAPIMRVTLRGDTDKNLARELAERERPLSMGYHLTEENKKP